MTTWQQFSEQAPDLAAGVQQRFEAAKHHVLATLRRDGSPRVSGTEVDFVGPELTLGSMWGAVKARDLQRDGRLALHSNPGDGSMAGGDAKVSGVAVEVVDDAELGVYLEARQPPQPFHLFRVDLREVVLTRLSPEQDCLLIHSWHPGEAPRVVERR